MLSTWISAWHTKGVSGGANGNCPVRKRIREMKLAEGNRMKAGKEFKKMPRTLDWFPKRCK